MSELRFNMISGDWVIIASERAKRPKDFKKEKKEEKLPERDKNCPFCPGNEGDCLDETFRIGDKKEWKARSVYNKYPALSPDKDHSRAYSGMYNFIKGFGMHEVIVEHRRHDLVIPLMPDEDVCNIVRIYKSRCETMKGKEGIEAITIFKNQGLGAGASLRHPHSQLVATPIVPRMTRSRIDNAMRYFDINGKCLFCQMLSQELNDKKRLVLETEKFVSFVPYAAGAPFAIWIFPKRHMASFLDIDDLELADFARNLKKTLTKLYHGLDNPDYNYTIYSIPVNESGREYFHWYLTIVPRITQLAGFELGSGIFINVTIPEDCASFLREVIV